MTVAGTMIDLTFDNRTKSYDRDKLAVALIVYLDELGDGKPHISVIVTVSHLLRFQHGFVTDSITYAIGARICYEQNIDPYGGKLQ